MGRVRRVEPGHRYLDEDNRVWPSVTQTLKTVPPWRGRFDHVPPFALEYKRQLGSAVHRALEFFDTGDLDLETVPETVIWDSGHGPRERPGPRPYLRAWERWKAESGFAHVVVEAPDGSGPRLASELVVWHEASGYAGTLDALGTVPGPGGTRRWLLGDAKTGAESDAALHGPQLAAYLAAARALGLVPADVVVQRVTVHLHPDGTYRLVPHTSRRDWHVFAAALEIHRYVQDLRRTA